jgi:hypothetical protein
VLYTRQLASRKSNRHTERILLRGCLMRALLVVSVVVFAGLALACGGGGSGGNVQQSQKPAAISREEFSKWVIGKSMDEVRAAFGSPYKTNGTGDDQRWEYKEICYDPETGDTDSITFLTFEQGKVVRVH